MISCNPLELEEYRSVIHLDTPFIKKINHIIDQSSKVLIVNDLLTYLQEENISRSMFNISKSQNSTYNENRQKLYSLLTIRSPKPLPLWFNEKLDILLQSESIERGITDPSSLKTIKEEFSGSKYNNCDLSVLWKGDITTLAVDAIVNAANNTLLGCFKQFHKCIDNVIHSTAGPRLRDDCNSIIQLQKCEEGTGWAKITRAYNLPSKFVLHTVGPIFRRKDFDKQKEELAQCYISCLNLANQLPEIHSIAFCAISTGVFGFPADIAAQIALNTVDNWLTKNPNSFNTIVFDVYSKKDYDIYKNFLKS